MSTKQASKKCTKCCRVKPLSDFYTDKRNKDGRQGVCKVCWKARSKKAWGKIKISPAYLKNKSNRYDAAKKWRQENKTRVTIYNKLWRETNPLYDCNWKRNNPDKIKKYWQNYYKKNREYLCLKKHKWCVENPDKVKLVNKKYYRKNRDKILAYNKTPLGKERQRKSDMKGRANLSIRFLKKIILNNMKKNEISLSYGEIPPIIIDLERQKQLIKRKFGL